MPLRADQQRVLAQLGKPRTASDLARRIGTTLARTALLLNDLAAMGRVHSALPAGMRRRRLYWRDGVDIDVAKLHPPPTAEQKRLLKLLDEPRTIPWLSRRCQTNSFTTRARLERLCQAGSTRRVELPGRKQPRLFYCRSDFRIDLRQLQAARRQQRLLALLRKLSPIPAMARHLGVSQPTATSDLNALIAIGEVKEVSPQHGPKPALYRRVDSIPPGPNLTAVRRKLLRHLRQPRLLGDLRDRMSVDYHRLVYELAYLRDHRLVRKVRLGGNKHAVAFCLTDTSVTPEKRRQLRKRWSRTWVESIRTAARRAWRRRR